MRRPATPVLAPLRTLMRALTLASIAAALLAAPCAALDAQAPKLTLVATIGCAECGGPDEFGSILDLAVDSAGGILVVADAAPILRRFDAAGKLRWGTAKSGNGPGEFVRPMRALFGPQGIQVVDMTQRRVSRLDGEGRFVSSAPLRGFPSAISARGRSGRFVVLVDDFRGGLSVDGFTETDSGKSYVALPAADARPPGTIVFPSLSIAPSGELAFARDNNAYRIQVVGTDGTVLRTLTRDLPQVRRTASEVAALERVRQRAAARVAAERTAPPPRGMTPPRVGGDPDLKPHIAIDGLRYDDRGRLWVRTMRGDETVTILDVFSPTGAFLGEVRVDGIVGRFAFAGSWLALVTEDADGFPVVRRYRVD